MTFYLLSFSQSTQRFGKAKKLDDVPQYSELANNIIIRVDGNEICFIRGMVNYQEVWEFCPTCDIRFFAAKSLNRAMQIDDHISDTIFFERLQAFHPDGFDWLMFNIDMFSGKFNLA